MGCLHSSGRQTEYRRPDLVVMDQTKKCMVTDVVRILDDNLILKRNENFDNYSELRPELVIMWDKETCIVPVIIGALGSISKDTNIYLRKLDILYSLKTL